MNYCIKQGMPTITHETALYLLSEHFPELAKIQKPDARGLQQRIDLDYYSFPQGFSSTSGPFGGIGGDAITSFQIEIWTCEPWAIVFCGGKVVKYLDNFKPCLYIEGL